ncbi:hypothetical protein V6N12_031372 [Hibiscus sabdariffa]|uniref:Uncharacterized protein n=1 Tax=Hibiscus sabdariffa TaxID=183260 RepID=A0ABR2B1S5_9ROSI
METRAVKQTRAEQEKGLSYKPCLVAEKMISGLKNNGSSGLKGEVCLCRRRKAMGILQLGLLRAIKLLA